MYNYYSNVQKRKVFISYYHGDQEAVNKFVRDFGDVFIPKTVGVKDGDFDFDSNDPQYIMRKIREQKLEDSTVTIVLVGSCTHSRRYVDWEVKASLQQGQSLPNGLIAINLPWFAFYEKKKEDSFVSLGELQKEYPQFDILMHDFQILNEAMRKHAESFDIDMLDWEYEKITNDCEGNENTE